MFVKLLARLLIPLMVGILQDMLMLIIMLIKHNQCILIISQFRLRIIIIASQLCLRITTITRMLLRINLRCQGIPIIDWFGFRFEYALLS